MSGQEDGARASGVPLPGGDFRLFIQKLGYQALIGLGIIENPLTGERSRSLAQAETVIADLAMLDEKTSGNLEPAEAEHLRQVLENVRSHYEALAGE